VGRLLRRSRGSDEVPGSAHSDPRRPGGTAALADVAHPGLALAASASIVTFAGASPYTWLNPGALWAGLTQLGQEHLLSSMHAGDGSALPVLRVNLRYGFGLFSLLVGCVALVCPWRWRRDELVLLAATIVFSTLVLAASSVFMHYCLPLAPLWSLLLWRLLHHLDSRRLWQLGCVLLLLAEPARASLQQRRLLAGPDTRSQAIA
jgi:hypothetical protein